MIGTFLLNRYELLEKLGEGGMGIVYKARCSILNRFVAIKILKKDLNNSDDFMARFKREANSVASLSHPNIVNIHDVGSDDDTNFLVMEYIDGKSLTEIISENGKISPEKAIDIALQITKALEIAHRNNIIHRDIKPDNILITEDNVVKLMDFGIAKVIDSVDLTSSNIVLGSANYISPEQGTGAVLDCRTDLYSFGIVMYQMLTGILPFKGKNSVSTVLKHISEPVAPPKDKVKHLPEDINKIVLKCLEKEPSNRFQSAKELWESLNASKESSKETRTKTDDTIIMSPQAYAKIIHEKCDETVIIDKEEISKATLLEKSSKVINNTKMSWAKKHKKVLSATVLAILAIFSLGIFLPKEDTTNTSNNTTTTQPDSTEKPVEKEIQTPKEIEKKKVPSLVKKKQDTAKKLISDNEFLVGNITSEYNDDIPSGYVIKQTPQTNTNYDKGGKIDLVISKGEKKSNSKKNENPKAKDKDNNDDDDKDKK